MAMAIKNKSSHVKALEKKVKIVMKKYQLEYPDVKVDRDYYPFKITEEWGECLQAFLMFTDRGRQKGKSKKEIKNLLEEELADVFGYMLLFAQNENIDLEKALDKKWFTYLSKSQNNLK